MSGNDNKEGALHIEEIEPGLEGQNIVLIQDNAIRLVPQPSPDPHGKAPKIFHLAISTHRLTFASRSPQPPNLA